MSQVTTNGHTYSDDGSAALDMRNGGHRTHLLPMLGDVITDVGTVSASALAASNSATAAQNYATALTSTSASSLLIATGSKTFTTQAGKQYAAGQWVTATSNANAANWMFGQVTSYSGVTLIVSVTAIGGAGTLADWNISISGIQGTPQTGAASVIRSARSSNTVLGTADKGAFIDVTSGTFSQTFAAAATLLTGWWCYIRNSGTGDVTLDPNGAETIDGLTSFVMYPGAVRLIQCDGAALRSIPIVGGTKVFTTTANYTWAPGIQQWAFDLVGAGGGGGGGARSTVRYNGGGGGAGERFRGYIYASQITAGASTSCAVGAGGAGGPAATGDNLPATVYVNVGIDGGQSAITGLVSAAGGKAATQAASNAAHGYGGAGGGKSTGATSTESVAGQMSTQQVATAVTPGASEFGGAAGRFGSDATGGVTSLVGGTKGGASGAFLSAGVAGSAGANTGDGGGGGAGNVNGSSAGTGGTGANGKITIVEII